MTASNGAPERRPVCYDITRLLTRVVNATPNGIDRVDHALATHFLAPERGALGTAYLGLRSCLIPNDAARAAVEGIAANWGERLVDPDDDGAFLRVKAWLLAGERSAAARRKRRLPVKMAPAAGTWLVRHARPIAGSNRSGVPAGAAYLNVSQFPLWLSSPFEWLEGRRDVRAIFFVHDLLPIEFPEYFRPSELERHRARLRNVARFAAGAIVTTRTVERALKAHVAELGRRDLPVFVAPTPMSPTFAEPRVVDPALSAVPYFVLCSTLEPRKNHLMLLAAWRSLAARMGARTPKLVLVGTRGWLYGPIIDLLARAPALRDNVFEIGGLSTPALKRLLDNAIALLMPSFGEGYGLPVHEALVAGTPVIASDVDAFREIDSGDITLLSPLDGEAWLAAIEQRTDAGPRQATPEAHAAAGDWNSYFEELEAFADRL